MNKPLVILLILFFKLNVFAAQADSVKLDNKFKHELSLNATFFVKQFINFSNSGITTSPYAFSYKLISPKQNAFRFGIGADLSATKDPDENSSDVSTSTAFILDYRLGYERRFDLGKKWMTFLGVDLTQRVNKQSTETTSLIINPNPPFNEIEATLIRNDQTIAIGGGPVFGIQINFTPRIALYTESSILLTHQFIKSEFRATPAISPETKDKSTRTNLDFVLPTSLYFAVNF